MAFGLSAQIQKPAKAPAGKTGKTETKSAQPAKDSVVQTSPADTIDLRDKQIRESRSFVVYTKRPKGKDKRIKLCYQITGDTVLNYCVNDTVLRDPEVYRELFRQKDGDTTYVLLYVDAFTKEVDKLCDGGHETKLVYFRWNTKRNKAIVKQRTIGSCVKFINNMSKVDLDGWDKKSPLLFEYNKGIHFYELTFDPARYKQGFITGKVGDDDDK